MPSRGLSLQLPPAHWSWLKGRLTWWSDETFSDHRKAAMARAAFYMLGAGAIAGLLSLTLPGQSQRNELVVAAISLAALLMAAVAVIGFDRLPEIMFHVGTASVTALIMGGLLFSGEEDSATAVFFLLVVIFAFNYFSTKLAVVQVGLIAIAQLVVVIARPNVLSPANAFLRLLVLAGFAYLMLRSNRQLRELVDDLARSKRAIESSRRETVYRLSRATEFRDGTTGQHTRRMGEICFILAQELGLGKERADLIRIASPLHDVGKIAIPDRILLKPGPLTPSERAVMQEHTESGFELLTGSGQRMLDFAASIALTHHERFDGKGYPYGLVGEAIPIEGRIAAIADVFDALTSTRPYRAAASAVEAVETIRDGSGTQFDPQILEAFLASLDDILEIRPRALTLASRSPEARRQAVA